MCGGEELAGWGGNGSGDGDGSYLLSTYCVPIKPIGSLKLVPPACGLRFTECKYVSHSGLTSVQSELPFLP